jgi:2'-5' RNA ligase
MPPATQASLPGFSTGHPTDRLFFAVMPPPASARDAADRARVLREGLALRGKPRPTEHLHVTLHHLGDFDGVPPQLVAAATAAAARVALAPFPVRFDRAGSFSGRPGAHPFVLLGAADAPGLTRLHDELGTSLAAAGLARRERPFVPHLTLLYDARQLSPQPIDPLGWTAQEFVLVDSLLGRAEYRLLGRWPLAGACA